MSIGKATMFKLNQNVVAIFIHTKTVVGFRKKDFKL